MLTYKFSRREKALVLVLVIIAVLLAWYILVFQSTTDQLTRLESEIATVEDETAIASAKVSQMGYMKQVIEEKKAAGVTPTPMPYYDNMQPLMTRLDTVMSVADSYQLSFGDLDVNSSKYIMRPVNISFTCDSYATAESIVRSLARGPYPCVVDSVMISDGSNRSSGNSACGGSVHVIFLEKNDGSFAVAAEEDAAAAEAAK